MFVLWLLFTVLSPVFVGVISALFVTVLYVVCSVSVIVVVLVFVCILFCVIVLWWLLYVSFIAWFPGVIASVCVCVFVVP